MKTHLLRSVVLSFCGLLFLSCATDTFTYLRKGGKHLSLSDGTHELFWFNGVHSNDPKNIMFADIEKEFLKFMPDLVLVEGGADRSMYQTRSEAILHGESGFVAYLAREQNIECLSIEPPDSYLGKRLSQTYSMNDIIAMIVVRQINQWQRESNNRQIDFVHEAIGLVRSAIKSMFSDNDLKASIESIQSITEPYIGFAINDENWRSVPAYKIIYEDTTILHAIWADTIALRNTYLLELIKEKKETYPKIFIMMGFDHARETMNDLQALYTP